MEDHRDRRCVSNRVSIHSSSSSSSFPLCGSCPSVSISSSSSSSSFLLPPISPATSSFSRQTSDQLFPPPSPSSSSCVCRMRQRLREGLPSAEKKVKRERPRASSSSAPPPCSPSLFSFSSFLSSCPTSPPPDPLSLSSSASSPQAGASPSPSSHPETLSFPPRSSRAHALLSDSSSSSSPPSKLSSSSSFFLSSSSSSSHCSSSSSSFPAPSTCSRYHSTTTSLFDFSHCGSTSLPLSSPVENRLSFLTTSLHGAPPPVFSPYIQISQVAMNSKKISANADQQSSTSSPSLSKRRRQSKNRELPTEEKSVSSIRKNSISSSFSSSSHHVLVSPSCPVSTKHSSKSLQPVASRRPPVSSVEADPQPTEERQAKTKSDVSREKGKEKTRGKEDTKNLVLLHLARLALLALGGTRKKGRRRHPRSREENKEGCTRGGRGEEGEAGKDNLSLRCKKEEERREDEVKPSHRSVHLTNRVSERHTCSHEEDDRGGGVGGGGGATCKEIGDYVCEILHYPDTPSFRSNLSRLLRECCVFHDTSFIKQVRRGVYTLTPHAIASSALPDSPLRVFRRSFFRTIPSLSQGVTASDGSRGYRTLAVLNKMKESSQTKEGKKKEGVDLKKGGCQGRSMLSSSEIHEEDEEREEEEEEVYEAQEEGRRGGRKNDLSFHGHDVTDNVEEVDRNTTVRSDKSSRRARKRKCSSLPSSPAMPHRVSSLTSSSSVKAEEGGEEEGERRGSVAGYLSVYKRMHSPGRALCYLPGGYAYEQSQEGRDAEAVAVINALQRLAKKSSPTPRDGLRVKRRGQSTCGERGQSTCGEKGQSTVGPVVSSSLERPKRCDEKKTPMSQGSCTGVGNEEVQLNERKEKKRRKQTSVPHQATLLSFPVSPLPSPSEPTGEKDDHFRRKRREDNHVMNGEISKQIRLKKKVNWQKDVNAADEVAKDIACVEKPRSKDAQSFHGSNTPNADDSLCSHNEISKKKREKEEKTKSLSLSVSGKEMRREPQLLFSSPCESFSRNPSHFSTSQDSLSVGNRRQSKKGSMKASLGRKLLSEKEFSSTVRPRREEQEEEEGSRFLPTRVERLSLAFSPSHQSEASSSIWACADAPSSRLVKGKERSGEKKKEEADAEKHGGQDNLRKTNTVEKARNTQTPTPVSPSSPLYSPVSSSFSLLPFRLKSRKKSKRRREEIMRTSCDDMSLKKK